MTNENGLRRNGAVAYESGRHARGPRVHIHHPRRRPPQHALDPSPLAVTSLAAGYWVAVEATPTYHSSVPDFGIVNGPMDVAMCPCIHIYILSSGSGSERIAFDIRGALIVQRMEDMSILWRMQSSQDVCPKSGQLSLTETSVTNYD